MELKEREELENAIAEALYGSLQHKDDWEIKREAHGSNKLIHKTRGVTLSHSFAEGDAFDVRVTGPEFWEFRNSKNIEKIKYAVTAVIKSQRKGEYNRTYEKIMVALHGF